MYQAVHFQTIFPFDSGVNKADCFAAMPVGTYAKQFSQIVCITDNGAFYILSPP